MVARGIDDMKNSAMKNPDMPVVKEDNVVWDSDDPIFRIECEDYTKDMKEYRLWRGRWEENQPWTYNLVLQHCPSELNN